MEHVALAVGERLNVVFIWCRNLRARENQHQTAHHPLEPHYNFVVDEN
jgi:hypothetical protein